MGQQFGDTTLTKVFVGGLAWETQKETLREHFEQYGEILEAVIISDKLTGRSKGYGFVRFSIFLARFFFLYSRKEKPINIKTLSTVGKKHT